jgi:outer membrane lipoprotein carrier protein
MNIKGIISVIFLFTTLLSSASADTSDIANSTALQQLVEKLQQIRTFSGTFVQYAVDQKGKRIQESRGELKADRSGLFYWQTFEPLQQIVVSDGKVVTVYDPDLEQATVQAIGQQAQTTPAILFSGDTARIGENFIVDFNNRFENTLQFILKPKTGESLFDQLLVRFEGNNVRELRITDALGQESTMSFIETQVNQAFPASTFTLNLPEGTDIIRDLPAR